MASWISTLLKELHSDMCQTVPAFKLIGKDGAAFTVLGFSKGCFFRSPFFAMSSLNEKSHCAVLEVLVPCSDGNHLFRTQATLLVHLDCFCGIEKVKVPVFDYLEVTTLSRDQFCLPFQLTKKDLPKTICRIEQQEVQNAATICIHYTGEDPQIELVLYTNEKIITLLVYQNRCQSITVRNLQSIKIETSLKVVRGMVEIQLTSCHKENIHF